MQEHHAAIKTEQIAYYLWIVLYQSRVFLVCDSEHNNNDNRRKH